MPTFAIIKKNSPNKIEFFLPIFEMVRLLSLVEITQATSKELKQNAI